MPKYLHCKFSLIVEEGYIKYNHARTIFQEKNVILTHL